MAPPNVLFPGYVSRDEYLKLRTDAGAILALTSQEMTMQSAGYEALADATPLVTSPRRVLERFFGEAAVYAESDSTAISEGLETVFRSHSQYAEKMARRRDRQIREQITVLDAIKARAQTIKS
ncbi:hypothetical protein JN084_07470 [Mycolicibacterium austroafricanum]|nr:hypothetical protein [Mycolicibacterium austroafricanum]QZT58424.1 hypothetical protein JN084_07470 [Mycolicibacterium austroafricanum]